MDLFLSWGSQGQARALVRNNPVILADEPTGNLDTILSICMIHYAVKINVMERQYEIGVLRSLGASKGQVIIELMTEQIIFGLIAFILSSAILVIIDKLQIIKFNGVSAVHVGGKALLLMLIVSSMVVIVSGIVDVIKVSNKPIGEAIKSKHL